MPHVSCSRDGKREEKERARKVQPTARKHEFRIVTLGMNSLLQQGGATHKQEIEAKQRELASGEVINSPTLRRLNTLRSGSFEAGYMNPDGLVMLKWFPSQAFDATVSFRPLGNRRTN